MSSELALEVDVLQRLRTLDECQSHPRQLLRHVVAWDEREAREFRFNMDDEGRWGWQAELVDFVWGNNRTILLKARQLGATWIVAGVALYVLLYKPGSTVLVYRQKEEEAAEVVGRIWTMYKSLPGEFLNGATVEKPKNTTPYNELILSFPAGMKSKLRGMTSTISAGHGAVGAFVIMDEAARIERAGEIMKAVTAVIGQTGRLCIISTANGRSNLETGEGNAFHRWWHTAEDSKLETRFLPWHLHPDRDQEWYDESPETRSLKEYERMEQYPNTPAEAFAFSDSGFFDKDALLWYDQAPLEPAFRGRFHVKTPLRAVFEKLDKGPVRVYSPPYKGDGTIDKQTGEPLDPPHSYAISVDTSTGKGSDFSSAYVIDLATMEIAAEIHGKIAAEHLAEQLHFLGKWYATARIAVEDAGGWGEPVIIFLRDGRDGRPPYPAFYRHRQFSRADLAEHKPFGFPVNTKTRPLIVQGAARAIRERAIPALPRGLIDECMTFVHRETGTSPAALDGCHDDRVMAFALACELYRQYGHHPDQHGSNRKPQTYQPSYPWEEAAA